MHSWDNNFAGEALLRKEKLKLFINQERDLLNKESKNAVPCDCCGRKVSTYYQCKHGISCYDCNIETVKINKHRSEFLVQCKENNIPVDCIKQKVILNKDD